MFPLSQDSHVDVRIYIFLDKNSSIQPETIFFTIGKISLFACNNIQIHEKENGLRQGYFFSKELSRLYTVKEFAELQHVPGFIIY